MVKLGFHPAMWIRRKPKLSLIQALDEISATHWDGFEYAGPGLEVYYDRVSEFKEELLSRELELSTYYLRLDFVEEERKAEEMQRAERRLDFLHALGVKDFLIDGGKKQPLGKRCQDFEVVAKATEEIARMGKERGITTSWHIHYGTMFERQGALEWLMENTDPELLRLCPDTAQMALGGFNIALAFEKYKERIAYVHFKDLNENGRFTELGRGTIDFPTLWQILKRGGFDGWIVVDLDYTELEPKESARLNKRYLNKTLGLSGRRDARG